LAAGWSNEFVAVTSASEKRANTISASAWAITGIAATAGSICARYTSCHDGRIVIGATSEEVGFTPQHPSWHSSLTGTSHQALSTITALSHPGTLVGFRPATPDELPILGSSPCKLLATGHHRNGIRAGNSCPDCRLNLEQSQTPTNSFQLLTVLPNRRQETGDRGQETGDGDRRQETGDRRQETGDRRGAYLPAPLLPISLLPISPAPHLPLLPSPLLHLTISQSYSTHSPHPNANLESFLEQSLIAP